MDEANEEEKVKENEEEIVPRVVFEEKDERENVATGD